MDALLLRSLQNYVIDNFGSVRWQEICLKAGRGNQIFEPMLKYEPGLSDKLATTTAQVLERPVDSIWEDVGIHLVTHPRNGSIRRLLRFGGVSFVDFLHSLEELPGRAWLTLPDADLPDIAFEELRPDRFELRCRSFLRGVQPVLKGVLSAMADDYGSLCLIDAGEDGSITISMLDSRHAAAKAFELAMPET